LFKFIAPKETVNDDFTVNLFSDVLSFSIFIYNAVGSWQQVTDSDEHTGSNVAKTKQ